jgi:hypothetical protein
MEKTIDATRIAPHGPFYMESTGGTHSAATSPTLIADEHQPSCFALEEEKGFALEEEKGADWKGGRRSRTYRQ